MTHIPPVPSRPNPTSGPLPERVVLCSRCHAIGARGRSTNKASPPFRTIANRYSDVELSERLADLSTGHFRMPPLNVTETDLKTLIAYLRTMREDSRPRGP